MIAAGLILVLALSPARGQDAQPNLQQSAALTRDAAAALGSEDYAQARALAAKAAALNSKNAQAWNYLSIADGKLKRYTDALAEANQSLAIASGNVPALQSRSLALNALGKYKEAMADADAVLARDAINAFAFQNRAFALAGLGEREAMREALKRSSELDARLKDRYDQALVLPAGADPLVLFDDSAPKPAAPPPEPSPAQENGRLFRLVLISASGGLLIFLALLHILSPAWRETVRMTIRRATGAAPPARVPAPSLWGQYEIRREIGSGGMGVVYEARDRGLDRVVAIKKMREEIRRDERERARFIDEAKTVAALHHPHIVDIYSVLEHSGDVYLVFEYVKGRTLADILKERGTIPYNNAFRILRDACDALDYAHRHRVIHRDIKPSNIMVADDGAAKIMDFGVARQSPDSIAQNALTNTIVGTPVYMAPEQEQGLARPQTDLYSLAIVFYECLSGRLPFAGQGGGMFLNKMKGAWAPLSSAAGSGLPAGLDAVLARALAPEPERRYATGTELVKAVAALGYPRAI